MIRTAAFDPVSRRRWSWLKAEGRQMLCALVLTALM